jgi:DNA-binding transcriptional MerR regulator
LTPSIAGNTLRNIMLTIGQLAKRVGVRPSTLRYYEQEGLLIPDGRSDAGYRLYGPAAEWRLLLIQRAQRLGFSLADVGTLLQGWDAGNLSNAAIIETAETRYLALEKRITELLTLKHELELFLQDLHRRDQGQTDAADSSFAQMLARVCANPLTQPPARNLLDWLTQYTGCRLASDTGMRLLDRLRGQHVHIWQEGEAYHILIVSNDPAVAQAVEELAELEAGCETHGSYPTAEMVYLALEQEKGA